MEVKLLSDGFKLLIVGQMTVLFFLGCIVFMIKGFAWMCHRFEKQPVMSEYTETAPASIEPVAEDADEEVAAAIAAVVHRDLNASNS